MTDKIYFNSMSNIIYMSADADEDYLRQIKRSATVLLDKISHVNRIFADDYFKGANATEYYNLLKAVNDAPALSAQTAQRQRLA